MIKAIALRLISTLILVVLSAQPGNGLAASCLPHKYPEDANILVDSEPLDPSQPQLSQFSVTVPAVLLGVPLSRIDLYVKESTTADDFGLIAHLQFEVKGERAIAQFIAQNDWSFLSIVARFGDQYCDPMLSIDVDTRSKGVN
jgi:hypothetical protein